MFKFLTDKFSNIFTNLTGKNKLTEANLEQVLGQIKDSLIAADVPLAVAEQLAAQVKSEVIGQKVLKSLNPSEQFIQLFHDRLKEFLGGSATFTGFQIPSVILVMGLQGSGKTTTIAKLANWAQGLASKKGKQRSILFASVDFYRPAAIDQLEVLAKQVNVNFYRAQQTDPVFAAQEVYRYFQKGGYEYLFLDTAGRMHVDDQMLQELSEINSILNPKYKLMVLDSMTGQESLRVAQAFDQAVGFNGAILTKMDSETLGGSALAFRYVLQKSIYFVGNGEKVEDLEQFHADRLATRLLGLGDLQTLMERAQDKFKLADQEKSMKAFESGRITLEDFSNQLDMVSKLGSLNKVIQYLPGLSGMNVSPEMAEKGDLEIKRFKVIISSMTRKERLTPQIINASRQQRIAKGAGVKVQDVNYLIQRFEESAQFVKLLKKQGRFQNMFKF